MGIFSATICYVVLYIFLSNVLFESFQCKIYALTIPHCKAVYLIDMEISYVTLHSSVMA